MKLISVLAITAGAACLALLAMFYPAVSANAGLIALSANPTAPRFHQAAVLLDDNTVLLAGGMRSNGAIEASAELYDPAARRFSPLPPMRTPRVGAVSAPFPGGNVLIAGGWGGGSRCLATAEIYDASRGMFRPAPSLSTPRCGALAFALKDGRILIVGGNVTPDDGQQASAEAYDPRSGTFASTGAMHVPRSSFAGAVLRDGRVLVMGGWSAGRYPNRTIEKTAEIYDPATGRFSVTGSMAMPRYKMGAVRLSDNRVFVVGGSDNRDWNGTLDSTEIFDPASGNFTRAANMNFKRFKLPDGVVALSDGRVLVVGGSERAELYDPAANAFTTVRGATLDGFYFSTAPRLAGNVVLIVGGYGEDPGAGAVDRAWLYRP